MEPPLPADAGSARAARPCAQLRGLGLVENVRDATQSAGRRILRSVFLSITMPFVKTKGGTRDRVVTFRPDDDLLVAMERLRERDGVPFSQQIRRALRTWLESKDMLTVRTERTPRMRPRGLPSWRTHE